MAHTTIYTAEGTQISNIDFFKNKEILSQKVVNGVTQVTFRVKAPYDTYTDENTGLTEEIELIPPHKLPDIYKKEFTVNVQAIKPTTKITVKADSQDWDFEKTLLSHTDASQRLTQLRKESPKAHFYAEIIALGDLTTGAGEVISTFEEMTSLDQIVPHSVDLAIEAVNAQTLEEVRADKSNNPLNNLKNAQFSTGTGPVRYRASWLENDFDHILYQYRIRKEENGQYSTAFESKPLIAEVKTDGQLFGK